MFTGLIELKAPVSEILPDGSGKRLTIRHAGLTGQLAIGDSVSVSGCCLTVVAVVNDLFSQLEFDVYCPAFPDHG